ncbi:MAG: hypothetical protein LBP56_03220 [Odoribacteraceae bacterium]|jgi:hypothetical protein|nr:hypothetical protein [Odoribacteraceae bacterium]
MKKQIIPFLALLVGGIALSACYGDKSSLDTGKLPEVVIDVAGTPYADGVIRVGYMEELALAPKVTKAGKEDHPDLSYRWTLNEIPDKVSSKVISEERDLDYVVQRAIMSNPYTLWLTVTDNATTMEYLYAWEMYVESSFGEGILVAYTRDGTTSDFALIMDSHVSADYQKETFIRDGLYEAANGVPVPALIKNACYTADAARWGIYQNIIRATTTEGILIVNCIDYSRMDDEMVYVPDNFVPDKFVKMRQASMLNAGPAGIYVMGQIDKKPTMPLLVLDNGGVADIKLSVDSHEQGDSPAAVWYHNGKFYRYNSPFSSPAIAAFDNTSITAAFDPTNLPGQECRAAGLSTDRTHTLLLKEIASGNHALYTFTREVNNYPDPTTPSVARAKIDIPASLNALLDQAVSIFFISDQAVMYVATTNAITPVIFAGGVVNAGTPYAIPAGETLVMAKLFQQGVYVDNRDVFEDSLEPRDPLPLNNRAVLFATSSGAYDSDVYVVPMVTNLASSGTLDTDPAKALKFPVEGKVLDIVMQGK